jgi:hypothetical protein
VAIGIMYSTPGSLVQTMNMPQWQWLDQTSAPSAFCQWQAVLSIKL